MGRLTKMVGFIKTNDILKIWVTVDFLESSYAIYLICG
jgi:hypothetical protein